MHRDGFLQYEPDEPRQCRDGHGTEYPLGLVAADSMSGTSGADLIDGDRFSGGPGVDVNVDFDASAGDVTDGS
jgi:hypothetical protein